MRKRNDTFNNEILKDTIKNIDTLFREYFNEYYLSNRKIKNIFFYSMDNNLGYSAVLEYKNFRQYVSFFYDYFSIENAVVNSCFEFAIDGRKFLCNFDDVFDVTDSEDLSFYTYSNCFENEAVVSSLGCIMSATEKYFALLNSIACSDFLKEKYIKENYGVSENLNSIIENAIDVTYVTYYKLFLQANESIDDYYKYLKKELAKLYHKNQLDTLYEKRAYRVLNNLSEKDIKQLDKELEKADRISKSDRFLMYLPMLILAVIFAIAFGIIGYHIDENIFIDCIGKKHYSSLVAFGFSGACVSLIISVLLPNSVYKLFVKKDRYDSFIRMVNMQDIQGPFAFKAIVYAFIIIAVLVIAMFFTVVFCFNGIAFKTDSIVYKEYAFSEMQRYSFEQTEIAIVEGSYNEGEYSSYIGTAYAFKLGDEWYDYGVPDGNEVVLLIESNIEKYDKNVKIYKSIEDIE